jgi:hypothetical protein
MLLAVASPLGPHPLLGEGYAKLGVSKKWSWSPNRVLTVNKLL